MSDDLSNLPEKKQKYLKNRAKGMNKKQAAIKAGYAESTASAISSHIETPDVKLAFRQAIQDHAPYIKVAKRVGEGLDAMETKFFQKDGFVMESKDVISWSERRQYAELAAQMGEYYTPKQMSQGIIIINGPAEGIVNGLDQWAGDDE